MNVVAIGLYETEIRKQFSLKMAVQMISPKDDPDLDLIQALGAKMGIAPEGACWLGLAKAHGLITSEMIDVVVDNIIAEAQNVPFKAAMIKGMSSEGKDPQHMVRKSIHRLMDGLEKSYKKTLADSKVPTDNLPQVSLDKASLDAAMAKASAT